MQPPERAFQFEGFTLDLRRGYLRGADGEIELRPKSFEVLRYLVENAGRLVSKDEIMKAVWPNVIVTDESLARCVSDVRFALGDRRQRIIRTVPRRGYLLTVPAAEAEANVAAPPRAESGISAASRNGSDTAVVEPHPPERRQLTVMACEFVGLAALSRRLDPEDLQAAITTCRQSWAEIIARHQGYIARYLEDGLLAYFGYPYASEHDAEHAARAGLALLRSAEQLSAPWRAPLQPRIGLASGVVVIAEESVPGGARESAAVGETPHLAKFLQMAAPSRSLVIDQSTRRLVGGLFECRDLGPIVVDGYPEGVPAWRVLEASLADNRSEARRRIGDASNEQIRLPLDSGADNPPPKPATENGLSPFVGRVRELEVLEGCIAEGAAQIRVIDIVGEPGIGKSRLLYEFRRRLNGSRARVWAGNCWPGDEQMPFRPFIEVVRRTFRLRPADPEAEITRKLEAGLALVGLATAKNLGLLLNLLGLRPPAHSLRGLDDVLVGLRTRDLLLRLVREGCRDAPVVIVLEDLHWIDNASQDLLARLIRTADAGAIAIVHTRRPEYLPPWASGQNTTTLALQPLAAVETSQIVRARLGVPELTGALARMITDRAEGNPLFAEEIANYLIEGGMVRRRAMSLEYDAATVAAAVPASVQSLLTARVDRLTPADRALLQAAAVIGRRFAPDLLAAVIGGESVESRLIAMQSLDLVRLDGAAHEFVFKHALVRDALYASLLSGPRQALHLEIAGEIERRNAGRLGEVAETLAHHYLRADHQEKAIEYLTLVGRKAIGIYSLDEGEHSLRTALTLARANDSERMDEQTATIMVDLAVVHYMQYRSAETIALIEPELDKIEALGDTVQAAILLDIYGVALFTSWRFREAKQMAHRSLAIAEPLGDRRSQAHARAGVIMMSVYVDPTPLADFEGFAERAYAEAEEGEDTYTVVRMTLVGANN
ncbi:MAG TPA: AAA family ATPase [Stellaceae bacterium]|nr:AAA family ATPase [Stellaceae bacterium]